MQQNVVNDYFKWKLLYLLKIRYLGDGTKAVVSIRSEFKANLRIKLTLNAIKMTITQRG
jgi:hypothetical protein